MTKPKDDNDPFVMVDIDTGDHGDHLMNTSEKALLTILPQMLYQAFVNALKLMEDAGAIDPTGTNPDLSPRNHFLLVAFLETMIKIATAPAPGRDIKLALDIFKKDLMHLVPHLDVVSREEFAAHMEAMREAKRARLH